MSIFTLMATVTGSTKRTPAVSSGKFGVAVENIASLKCFPLDPVSAEIATRMGLDTPLELLQTFVEGGLDIVEGDILTVAGKDYPIKAVSDWLWREDNANYLRLILEQLKNP